MCEGWCCFCLLISATVAVVMQFIDAISFSLRPSLVQLESVTHLRYAVTQEAACRAYATCESVACFCADPYVMGALHATHMYSLPQSSFSHSRR